MSSLSSSPITEAETAVLSTQVAHAAPPRGTRWVEKSRLYVILFLLMSPTLIGLLLFTYYPQYAGIKYSFFDWDGGQTREDFRGLDNYTEAFKNDKLFWPTFTLVLILFAANVVKMIPSICAAVVLHRLRSERFQYIYRVLFVVPMVIPGVVMLLIWKNFYDPLTGPLNKFLNATGLMHLLTRLDVIMPNASASIAPKITQFIDPAFASIWGMLVVGVMFLSATYGFRSFVKLGLWWVILIGVGFGLMGPGYVAAWVLATMAIGTVLRGALGETGRDIMKWTGGAIIGIGAVLVLTAMIWTQPIGQFAQGTPQWLSNSKLIIPAIILWGFPWIGTIGVLIYLAGLQNISTDVYEAAEIDGVGSVGRLFQIELPLILTQVRINLILMTIGTLTDYGLFLLLLGPDGGPNNVGMTPGLYMYKTAIIEGRMGYSCALGMLLAALILLITMLYQKYVKVDK